MPQGSNLIEGPVKLDVSPLATTDAPTSLPETELTKSGAPPVNRESSQMFRTTAASLSYTGIYDEEDNRRRTCAVLHPEFSGKACKSETPLVSIIQGTTK